MKNHSLLTLVAALLLAACGNNGSGDKIELTRLDQLLFQTPAAQLQPTLRAHAPDYRTQVLNLAPDNPAAMQMLTEFVADPGMRHIFGVTDSLYHDLGWLEHNLGKAYARARKLLPELQYSHFYTLVTGDFDDYTKRVFGDRTDLAISLDHYAVGRMGGVVPVYIERLCRPEYIAADCMGQMAAAYIERPEGEFTLLDYAIAEGKRLYFIEKTLPHLADTILYRYSPAQLRWAETYVGEVWSFMLREQLLYSHDFSQFHNLIDEAPKTNAFGDGSAPRMPAYIGLAIVRRYMKRTGSSMQDLFANTRSQQILAESGWRP